MYKTIILSLLCVGSFIANAQIDSTKVNKNFHLYLLVGQSNMAGRGYVDSLSKVENARVLMLNAEGSWVPAIDPLHNDKKEAGVGPGISFANAMLADTKDKKVVIGLIPCAVGGTSIGKWTEGAFDEKTNTHPYDDAIAKAKDALRYGVLKGILWHQGEANTSSPVTYLTKLNELVAKFRTVLNAPKVPFVAGELGNFNDKKIAFNQMLQALPSKIDNAALVSAEGLTANKDNIHFDTRSARELGLRYAEAMKKLQKK